VTPSATPAPLIRTAARSHGRTRSRRTSSNPPAPGLGHYLEVWSAAAPRRLAANPAASRGCCQRPYGGILRAWTRPAGDWLVVPFRCPAADRQARRWSDPRGPRPKAGVHSAPTPRGLGARRARTAVAVRALAGGRPRRRPLRWCDVYPVPAPCGYCARPTVCLFNSRMRRPACRSGPAGELGTATAIATTGTCAHRGDRQAVHPDSPRRDRMKLARTPTTVCQLQGETAKV
jgi:hypothetical protein